MKNVIVAAANRYVVSKDGKELGIITVADNCHGGNNMRSVLQILRALGATVTAYTEGEGDRTRGQGFIDTFGIYRDRGEALEIVKASGQPYNRRYVLPSGHSGYLDGNLDSSCIRHFPEGSSYYEQSMPDITPRNAEEECIYNLLKACTESATLLDNLLREQRPENFGKKTGKVVKACIRKLFANSFVMDTLCPKWGIDKPTGISEELRYMAKNTKYQNVKDICKKVSQACLGKY